MTKRKNKYNGSLILPWPNTAENIRNVVRDLQARGFFTEIVKTDYETYVRTNAQMKPKRSTR